MQYLLFDIKDQLRFHPRLDTPIPREKPLVVQYNKQTNMTEIRSMTLENIQ